MAVHFKLYRQAISYNVFDVYEVSRKTGLGRSAEGMEPDTLSQAMPQINRSITAMRNTPLPAGFVHVRTIGLRPCFESHIWGRVYSFQNEEVLASAETKFFLHHSRNISCILCI
jgi:hypothetical protein